MFAQQQQKPLRADLHVESTIALCSTGKLQVKLQILGEAANTGFQRLQTFSIFYRTLLSAAAACLDELPTCCRDWLCLSLMGVIGESRLSS